MSSPVLKVISPSYWKQVLRTNYTRVSSLAHFLELSAAQLDEVALLPDFPLQVPRRIAIKMAKGTLDDPLVKQFLPLKRECEAAEGFHLDPVCDASFQKEGKLLKKYPGRVLLLCTSACAMHCRYCFRQNFDYDRSKSFKEELSLIEQDRSIHEVILSGGDPLSLSDDVLENLLDSLSVISHIKRIRFHTRFPIGIPERIDSRFLDAIRSIPQQVHFVVHCNHPRELDQEILERLNALQKLGCTLLNQAVLLKGVNDDHTTLHQLGEVLANHGILFYYLHQLDRVRGSAHFEVDEKRGRQLVSELAKALPGYAVPKYVREIPGRLAKTPL